MDQPDDSGYGMGVLMFCIGAVVELLTEPLVIFGQAHQYVTTKVGGVGKCCITHCNVFVGKGTGGGCISAMQMWLYCCRGDVVSPMGHDCTICC